MCCFALGILLQVAWARRCFGLMIAFRGADSFLLQSRFCHYAQISCLYRRGPSFWIPTGCSSGFKFVQLEKTEFSQHVLDTYIYIVTVDNLLSFRSQGTFCSVAMWCPGFAACYKLNTSHCRQLFGGMVANSSDPSCWALCPVMSSREASPKPKIYNMAPSQQYYH